MKLHLHGGVGCGPYYRVRLCRDGKPRTCDVHILVAEAFLGPRPEGMQVRHGPAGSLDNSVTNLSYGTPVENGADMYRDGTVRIGTRNPNAKLTEDIVRECRERYAAGGVSYAALAREFGVSAVIMGFAIRGLNWRHVA